MLNARGIGQRREAPDLLTMATFTDAIFPYIYVWLLAAVRIVGIVTLAPAFSARAVPVSVRVYFALALGAVMGAHVSAARTLEFSGLGAYVIAIFAELALGAVIGFGISLIFEAVRFAGEALDIQVGLAQATALDPATSNETAVISRAYYFVALVIFLQLDGHHWVLAGLGRSFDIVPIGAATFSHGLAHLILELVGGIFSVGLRLAAPVMAAVFLTDLAFGFIARVVPQMNVFLVGIPAKLLVGLAVLSVSAPLLLYTVSLLVTDLKDYMILFIRLLAP